MARKTADVILSSAYARDAGKHFLLTEMPAAAAEKWAWRALLALTRAGVDVPDDVMQMGMGAIAVIGMRAFGNLSFDEAEPLLDEMMRCVEIVPDAKTPQVRRPLDDEDLDEVKSRVFLRNEVVALHVGFSIAAELAKFRAAAAESSPSPIPTSPSPSAQ